MATNGKANAIAHGAGTIINAMATWKTPGKTFKDFLLADAELVQKVSPSEIETLFDASVHFREVNNTFRKVGIK